MFPTALRRDIIVLLTLKAAILAALYFAFFASPHANVTTHVAAHLFDSASR